jgi:hypothetical protein
LNDPANLESENPAIKRAAEIKQAEDDKPQKIKAIKYLTSIGCGCYDKDGSVTDALVAAAEDCTEDVRLVLMEEVRDAARGKSCSNCGEVCCCNDKLIQKLAEVAYERDEFGCYLEPSMRVRQAAAQALAACCPGSVPLEVLAEGAAPEPIPEPEPTPVPERSEDEQGPIRESELDGSVTMECSDFSGESHRSMQLAAREIPLHQASTGQHPLSSPRSGRPVPEGIAYMRQLMAESGALTASSPNPGGGVVMAVDPENMIIYVHFEEHGRVVPRGTQVYLKPDPALGSGFNGSWQVVDTAQGCANLRPLTREGIAHVQVGDHVNFGQPEVVVTTGFHPW